MLTVQRFARTLAMPRNTSHRADHAKPAKVRLIQLIRTIGGPEGLSTAQLARRFGVRNRTIERDIKLLKGAGVRIAYDRKNHRYRMTGESFLAPLEFTPKEAMALLLLASHIGDDPILHEPATRAMDKIRSQLPPAMWTELEPAATRISVRSVAGDDPGADADAYLKIESAIRQQCEMDCVYEAAHSREGNNRRAFTLRPYHLLFGNRAWYVVGFCTDRNDLRTLKLVRFEGITTTARKFRMPKDFSIASYLGNCWRLIPGKPRAAVRLHIAREFAASICETQWHHTQEAVGRADGSVILEFTVDGFDEIAWWILSMGPQCRVLQPPELAAKVCNLAARTAELYTAERDKR